ncbi:MAG: hypothetical protein WC326_15830 [Candidatus Delongbacteria bacterium]
MKRFLALILIPLLGLLAGTGAARATGPSPAGGASLSERSADPALAPAPSGPLQDLQTATQARLQELEARALAAPAAEGEALQLEICELKRSAELQRLERLALACRRAGRLAEARLAEEELARLGRAVTPDAGPTPLTPAEKARFEATRPQPTVTRPATDSPSSTAGGER